MRGDQYNGTGLRSQKRKRKVANKVLNISIGLVVLLILLIGGQLLLGGKSTEPVVSDNLEDREENNSEAVEENDDSASEVDESTDADKQEEQSASDSTSEEQASNDSTEQTDSTNQNETEQTPPTQEVQSGEWSPIGTVQEEPFAAVYERDHVNWEEMTRAFQYATGLGEEMTLWHVRNGGDHLSSVGIVANYENRTTPYEVRIEWVKNEGWMPVSVVKLEENPYFERYTSSSNEDDDE